MSLALGLIGAAGKMGKAVLACSLKDSSVRVTGGCTAAGSPHIGKDLGHLIGAAPVGIMLGEKVEELAEGAEILIDFSLPNSTAENARIAAKYGKPLVIGSTGHSAETKLIIDSFAKEIPLLFAPNFSLGMALCLEACAFFGRHLKGVSFVDIIETHHTQKRDAPSGTALALAKSLDFDHICPGSLIQDPRNRNTIAIHSIRAGEVPGTHSIVFECEGERIEIKHEVRSREAFAKGAIKAAKFLAGCSPGLYTMKDLLHSS